MLQQCTGILWTNLSTKFLTFFLNKQNTNGFVFDFLDPRVGGRYLLLCRIYRKQADNFNLVHFTICNLVSISYEAFMRIHLHRKSLFLCVCLLIFLFESQNFSCTSVPHGVDFCTKLYSVQVLTYRV